MVPGDSAAVIEVFLQRRISTLFLQEDKCILLLHSAYS